MRIGQKHRAAYEKMIGGPLFDFDAKQLDSDGIMKPVYPRHGSPGGTGVSACWYQADSCKNPKSLSLFPTDVVRANVNEVFVNAGKALGAYMRRLRSRSSPYDRWLAGDAQAMSAAAQRGLRLFIGKAECIMCHSGPNFTDWRFHNLGVPIDDPERRLAGSLPPQNPDDLQKCFDGFGPAPICPDPGRQGWQLRAAGQCAKDTDTIDTNNRSVRFGMNEDASGNRFWHGDIDEVRVSSVVRSPDWVRLQYENQKPFQTLVGPLVQMLLLVGGLRGIVDEIVDTGTGVAALRPET